MGNADSALTQEDITYMSEHTGMGKDEVKSYFAKFKKTGDPRKAKLNLEEFSSIMAGCFPKTEHELAADIFRIYDVDNNGTVEFEEFLMIIYVMSDGTKEDKLKHIFRIFDCDGNGTISSEELTKIVSHLYCLLPEKDKVTAGTPQQLSEQIMREMDRNKDAVVSIDELMSAFFRQEPLTTLLVHKVMQRAATAQSTILMA
eukprot:TRINITY_DN22400_c1_g1_i1.p1 TRINITY_DN22400_c1_g1~~TRINITY_DN22400_c1_g1_i1.p1  ORF type:complete len:201 (+),score=59.24 TRINITY_DN22400_c1_g1_i1:62-664(+)